MTSVRCGCGTLHNPFYVITVLDGRTLGILHHSPIRDIYFSGDLKSLQQYRAGMKRGWRSEADHPNRTYTDYIISSRRALWISRICTRPSPTQQMETSSAVFANCATAALVSGNCSSKCHPKNLGQPRKRARFAMWMEAQNTSSTNNKQISYFVFDSQFWYKGNMYRTKIHANHSSTENCASVYTAKP